MKIMKSNNIEYLSKDILDEEFIKSLRVMYSFQNLLASSRVDLKDRFVTTPSLFQKCYTLLSVILLLSADYIIVHKHNLILLDNETLYYLSNCVTGLQSVTFLFNIIHVRFFNGPTNVHFFVKLQQIDRCMKLDRNKSITALLVRVNIFSLVMVLIIFITLLIVAGANGNGSFWPYLGNVYSQLSFVIELVSCSNIIYFFCIRARFMNSIIINYLDQKKTQQILFSKKHPFYSLFPNRIFFRRLAAESHNFISSDTDVYLKEILNGFSEFQDIYRFQVSAPFSFLPYMTG